MNSDRSLRYDGGYRIPLSTSDFHRRGDRNDRSECGCGENRSKHCRNNSVRIQLRGCGSEKCCAKSHDSSSGRSRHGGGVSPLSEIARNHFRRSVRSLRDVDGLG